MLFSLPRLPLLRQSPSEFGQNVNDRLRDFVFGAGIKLAEVLAQRCQIQPDKGNFVATDLPPEGVNDHLSFHGRARGTDRKQDRRGRAVYSQDSAKLVTQTLLRLSTIAQSHATVECNRIFDDDKTKTASVHADTEITRTFKRCQRLKIGIHSCVADG